MNTSNVATLLIDNVKTVKVKFKSSDREYTYKTTLDLEVGDMVIVEVENVFKVVFVSTVHEALMINMNSERDYKWIVQKVDTTEYEKSINMEAKFQQHLAAMEQQAVKANALTALSEKFGITTEALKLELNNLTTEENNNETE